MGQIFFREALNIALPTYLPDARMLIRQPLLWYYERHSAYNEVAGRLFRVPPPRPTALSESDELPQRFPPSLLQYSEGIERLWAGLYWLRFLDSFHWPGVHHFASMPDLLYRLVSDDHVWTTKVLHGFAA